MALRNAFADLALDATVGAVRDLLTSILGRLPAAVDRDGGLPVHLENTALPLPAGASTEATLADLDAVAERASRFLSPSRAIPYARTSSDQMRVVVDMLSANTGVNTGQIGYVSTAWAAQGVDTNYYSAGSPNAVDARELLKVQSRANARSARARWSLT